MKRILIVEDNEDMRKFYAYMFRGESRKYAIEIEADPVKAMERLKRKRFDLLISDIVMEFMSGERFLNAVREDKMNADMPVLVVTVLKMQMLGQLEKMRNIYFLEKPISQEELFKMINKIMRR